MDVYEIKYDTRPASVPVYSKAAMAQVTRLIAALAHYNIDQDEVSRARVSEAQAGLERVMELDAAVKKFRGELDNTLRMVQDRFYRLQDDLDSLTPGGIRYTVPQTKGTNHNVGSQGQAQRTQPTSAAGVSAGGNPKTIGAVLPAGTGEGQPAAAAVAKP